MNNTDALLKQIQAGLKEWSILNESAMIVKDRIREEANSGDVPYISNSDLRVIQAPDSKWSEIYHLIVSAQRED